MRTARLVTFLLLLVLEVGGNGSLLMAQTPGPGQPAGVRMPPEGSGSSPGAGARINPGMVAAPGATGSIPSDLVPGVLNLTIDDTLERALKYNLALAESDTATRYARVERLRALSRLLPTVNIRPSVTEQQIDLAAYGFSAPGFPSIVGPFTVVDARGSLSQSVFSLRDLRNYRASRIGEQAAGIEARDIREQVVLVAAGLYLQALAASARIDAQRAQLATSETAFKLASDRRAAGTSPGIDVLRAQVQMEADQQRLIYYEGEFDKAKLDLARAIGLAPGQEFRLADTIPYVPLSPETTVENALGRAYQARSDYRALETQVKAAELAKSAARAGRYPTASFDANYGVIGPNLTTIHGTFGVIGAVDIPIFQAGRVTAAVENADATLRQRQAELADMRGRIDAEVRRSFTDLRSASRQVEVAMHSVQLAGQQLGQAQDRFRAGVTNNLEVVQAQQAAAAANDNYIGSLYAYNVATVQMLRARGDAEQSIREFLRRRQPNAGK
jgi:outer membrane protein TolC